MQNALLVGLSRQVALGRELDVVANNIANINTTGYKADSSLFEEYLMPARSADDVHRRRPARELRADRGTWHDLSRARSSAPATRSTSPSTATPSWRCRRRAASATPATARCRSTPPASSSPATAIRCWATTARSRSSPPTTTSSSAGDGTITRARRQQRQPTRCAASCSSSPSTNPQQLQKDGSSTFAATGGVHAAAGDDTPRRAGRHREVERAARVAEMAPHDRDHPQPTPRSPTSCSSRATKAQPRSTSSPTVPN